MRNPFRRQIDTPAPTLRERAANLRARFAHVTQAEAPAPPAAEPDPVDWDDPPPGFMALPEREPAAFVNIKYGLPMELERLLGIAQKEFKRRTDGETSGRQMDLVRRDLRLDALTLATHGGGVGQHPTAGGFAHGDGTVSYTAANGHVSRAPFAQWVGFAAMQMHTLIQGEIARQRVAANALDAEGYAAWEAKARCELRSDAVHALAFRHVRAFEAAQALRSGVEPTSPELRQSGDAELLALAPAWEAAMDLYQQRVDEQHALEITATADGWPGRAPEGSGPEWRAWFQQKEEWRERTGIAAAEEASGDAGTALHEIELKISVLPAVSLAGLKLKARVGQRSGDIGVDWPDNLGAGLARDILAFVEAAPADRRDVTKPDALAAAILDGWEAWGAALDRLGDDYSDEEANAAVAPMNRLVRSAAELPAIAENIAAKALACAWMEWVCAEHPGQPRDVYGRADQLVYDINAAIMAHGVERAASAPKQPGLLTAAGINLATASLSELRAIRDAADILSDVVDGLAFKGPYRLPDDENGAFRPNAAGQFALWLSNELCWVISVAEAEARRRKPASDRDQENRLAALAVSTIENGDKAQTAAFARELLAMVEA